jgi:hypothetical protein
MEEVRANIEHLNYETWCVWTDILRFREFKDKVNSNDIQQITRESLFKNKTEDFDLVELYAKSFLSCVNYEELTEVINENIDNAKR